MLQMLQTPLLQCLLAGDSQKGNSGTGSAAERRTHYPAGGQRGQPGKYRASGLQTRAHTHATKRPRHKHAALCQQRRRGRHGTAAGRRDHWHYHPSLALALPVPRYPHHQALQSRRQTKRRRSRQTPWRRQSPRPCPPEPRTGARQPPPRPRRWPRSHRQRPPPRPRRWPRSHRQSPPPFLRSIGLTTSARRARFPPARAAALARATGCILEVDESSKNMINHRLWQREGEGARVRKRPRHPPSRTAECSYYTQVACARGAGAVCHAATAYARRPALPCRCRRHNPYRRPLPLRFPPNCFFCLKKKKGSGCNNPRTKFLWGGPPHPSSSFACSAPSACDLSDLVPAL